MASINKKLLGPNYHGSELLPWALLAYLVFLFFPIWYGEPRLSTWIASFISIACYLQLHFGAFRSKTYSQSAAIVFGISVLGALTIWWNPGGNVYIIYASSFAAFLMPVRRALAWMAICLAIGCSVLWVRYQIWPFILMTLVIGIMVGVSNLFWRQMMSKNRELRDSQAQIDRLATVAERERIARDLHDVLGHTLSSITLKSELAQRLLAQDSEQAGDQPRNQARNQARTQSLDQAIAQMADVERLARDTLTQVRATVSGYRSSSIMQEIDQARVALRTQGTELTSDLQLAEISEAVQNEVGLAMREAFTNVMRHAKAKAVELTIRVTDSIMEIKLADDGVGWPEDQIKSEGCGLDNIRKRIQSVGGSVEIFAAPGIGTKHCWRIPLEPDSLGIKT